MTESLSQTPLHQNHIDRKARMVPFAGFEMPVQYSGVLDETTTVRKACGLFDVSHMGQFSIRGAEALAQVNGLVTNDLSRLKLGQAQYNFLCKEDGGVIDDLVIYRRDEDHIYICVNASNRAADREWIESHLKGVTFEDQSDDTALIALQGPKAEAILSHFCDASLVQNLKYYWGAEGEILGAPFYLSRTGYTGEDGFELYVPANKASDVWEALLDKGSSDGLIPIGLGARDTLRLEMGYALYGHELNLETTPLSANLGWAVRLDQGSSFIGQDALKNEKTNGSPKTLKAMVIEDKRIARQGYAIHFQGKKVGEVTSGTQSPHRGAPIALGFVSGDAMTASDFEIEVRGKTIPAKVTSLPFVPSNVKRNKPKKS